MRKPTEKRKVRKTPPARTLKVLPKKSLSLTPGTTTFKGVDGKNYTIEYKQKLFCEYYLEFKGNRIDAMIEAGYDVYFKSHGVSTGVVNRNMAATMAAKMLRKVHIFAYITLKLKEYGFDDDNVEKQHLFLINQFDDLSTKGRMIDSYYKLKGKFPNDKGGQIPEEIEEFLVILRRRLPASSSK